MKKIGAFITSLFAALTLAGVGIGVGQNLSKNDNSNLGAFTYPSISSGYALYCAPQGDIVVGETVTFDFGIYDKDDKGVSGVDFFILSNVALSNFSFTPSFDTSKIPYNENGTQLNNEEGIEYGDYLAYQITFGIDVLACNTQKIEPSIIDP